jgi:hypothetical protein
LFEYETEGWVRQFLDEMLSKLTKAYELASVQDGTELPIMQVRAKRFMDNLLEVKT